MKLIPTFIVLLTAVSVTLVPESWARNKSGSAEEGIRAYLDTNLTFEERAGALVSRMTLDEKISQMQSNAPGIPRLGVPAYNWWNECLHGVARNGIATVFPQAIGMAATWDPKLIQEEADVISTEARAKYNYAISKGEHGMYQGLTFWSPNINIDRDPRWGRGQETYGEDPFLTSQIGVAFVRGLQGDNPKYLKVVATPKHFAVHSGPETSRHSFNAVVSNRDLFETYLPAFEACVRDGGAFSIMGAYNSLNGIPCTADSFLLTYILRHEWGFKGYVVSDCGAIWDIYEGHKYTSSLMEASVKAVEAGCDLTCGDEYSTLKEAVEKGLISEADIGTAVMRLMLARFRLGMFDPPSAVSYSKITIADNNTPAHRELSRQVADESIVLLKNARHTLPLKKSLKSVAVIGVYADDIDVLLGDYHGTPSEPVTILQGIRNKLGPDVRVRYAGGYDLLEDEILNPTTISSEFVSPPGEPGIHGLYAEYFNNTDLKGKPVLTRIDTTLEPYWGLSSPGEGIPAHEFSMRWTGTITPPETGEYHLGIITDQKGRLYLDGKLLVDNWSPFEINVFKSKVVELKKGNRYSVEIDYADSGDFAGIRFQWQKIRKALDAAKLLKDAVETARESDAVIAVAGISPQLESEENNRINLPGFRDGDRTRLRLPEAEEKVLKALYATGKPVVLVLVGGSALAVNWEQEHLSAIVDAWYPGEEGGNAVADVLFGDYNPAGRLPVTFYRSVKDLPPFSDYSMSDRTYRYFNGTPLFPFGFGLSYTKFEYSNLEVNDTDLKRNDTLSLSFDVRNAGGRDGDEVVQLYLKDLTLAVPHPIKSLGGFRRLNIKRGESRKVEFSLPMKSFRYFDEKRNEFVVAPGEYQLQIGSSSTDIRLTKTVRVGN